MRPRQVQRLCQPTGKDEREFHRLGRNRDADPRHAPLVAGVSAYEPLWHRMHEAIQVARSGFQREDCVMSSQEILRVRTWRPGVIRLISARYLRLATTGGNAKFGSNMNMHGGSCYQPGSLMTGI